MECRRLDENYRLNEAFEPEEEERRGLEGPDADEGDSDDEDPEGENPFWEDEPWEPEAGEDFWDGEAFDLESWETALLEHINLLKTEPKEEDPAERIQQTIGYWFINENLLRQAFTRRAFAQEYGLSGDSEVLEFFGDTVLNMIVSREMADRYTDVNPLCTDAPFRLMNESISEGSLSRIRSQFVCKEHLAARAEALGLDRYILYGTGETENESAKEDAMEALIGAVAADSGWNQEVLTEVADRLLSLQLDFPDRMLKQSYYTLFNAWHQKHFGRMPEYEMHGSKAHPAGQLWPYECTICFSVPENETGIPTEQRQEAEGETHSKARELAAEFAYHYVVHEGLWMNLKEAHVIPSLENSINQLQELYQKKYLEAPAEYTFTQEMNDRWFCSCVCGGVHGSGYGPSKTKAKKKAAFMALVLLLESAGCCKKEWMSEMWRNVGR